LHLPDNKSSNLSFAPADVGNVIGHGVAMQLLGGWIAAVSSALRQNASMAILPTSIVLLVVLLWSPALLLLQRHRRSDGDRSGGMRAGAIAMGIGLLGLFIGYVPLAFTNAIPTVDEINGRINAAAALGTSLFLVGALFVAVHGSPVPQRARRPLFQVVLVLAVGVALLRELRVGDNFQSAWQTQQRFWRVALPDIARAPFGTTVVLAAPQATTWDTIYQQPPVDAQSVIQLALGIAGPNVLMAYRQDLRACGVLDRHTPGERLLVSFERRGLEEVNSQTYIPPRNIALFIYEDGQGRFLKEVHGPVDGSSIRCQLLGTASMNRFQGTLTDWGTAAMGR
jgi:hypothetical protein